MEVKETDIALILVAGRRPELLKRTLRSFGEKVFDNFRIVGVFANIDPFMGTAEDGEACKKIILDRFPSAEISAPATPDFSEAVRSLWSKPRQPYFFHLEDDWLVLDDPPSEGTAMPSGGVATRRNNGAVARGGEPLPQRESRCPHI